MTTVTEMDIARALGADYLLLRSELTEQETDYLDRTRRFVDEEVLPVTRTHLRRWCHVQRSASGIVSVPSNVWIASMPARHSQPCVTHVALSTSSGFGEAASRRLAG